MVLTDYSHEPVASIENIVDSVSRLSRYFIGRALRVHGLTIDVAEELTQDTFIRAYIASSKKTIYQRGLPNFLKMIFDNLCCDYRKNTGNKIFLASSELMDFDRPCGRTPYDESKTSEVLKILENAQEVIERLKAEKERNKYDRPIQKIKNNLRARLHI